MHFSCVCYRWRCFKAQRDLWDTMKGHSTSSLPTYQAEAQIKWHLRTPSVCLLSDSFTFCFKSKTAAQPNVSYKSFNRQEFSKIYWCWRQSSYAAVIRGKMQLNCKLQEVGGEMSLSHVNAYMYIGGGWFFPPAVSGCVTSVHHQQLSDLHKVSPVKQHFCSPPSVRHGGKSPTVFYIWLRVGSCHVRNGDELRGWRMIVIHCRKGLTDLHFNLFFFLYIYIVHRDRAAAGRGQKYGKGVTMKKFKWVYYHYTWTLQV